MSEFHLDLFSQLGDLHDGIDVNIPASTASFDAPAFTDDASLVAPLPQPPGFTFQQQQQHTLPTPPVMAMPAQSAFGGGLNMSSQAALIQAQMQLRQMQSALGQQTSLSGGSSSAGTVLQSSGATSPPPRRSSHSDAHRKRAPFSSAIIPPSTPTTSNEKGAVKRPGGVERQPTGQA